MKKKKNLFAIISLCLILLLESVSVFADPSDDIDSKKEEKDKTQAELDKTNSEILDLQAEADDIESQIDFTTGALVQIMTDMEVLEADISDTDDKIKETKDLYDQAVINEQEQYESMKIRIKYLYENGRTDLISIYLESGNISQALSKAEYVESLYSYDRQKLEEYQATVKEVNDLYNQLLQKQDELLALQESYEEEETYLETVLADLQLIADDYESRIQEASLVASQFAATIREQNAEIARLEQEKKDAEDAAAKAAAEEAIKKYQAENTTDDVTVTTDDVQDEADKAAQEAIAKLEEEQTKKEEETRQDTSDSISDSKSSGVISTTNGGTYDVSGIYASKGSDLGKTIAVYACQFIGNPYVYGGTSLTEGADCSGFTQSIYKEFGYSLPRTSYDQRSAGVEVAYEDAEPGDIICYAGHVAMYIGNGLIVHASTTATGIKVSNATYTTIITVRRIV